jgi:hypothetical protein
MLMVLLCVIATGESHTSEAVLGRTHLGDECRHKVREGIWVILRQGFGKYSEEACDILEAVELDEARRDFYATVLKGQEQRRR